MNTEIILPMYYLMLLTMAVFLFSTLIRLKEIFLNKSVAGEEHRHPPFDQGSRILKNAQRNLTNLFEFPILFYAVCICIFMTGNVDKNFIILANWFFYLRVIHSIYHIFFNQLIFNDSLPIRTFIWVPATAILFWMWVRFISVL
tara:strand:- start:671 stop:1102 length:432 start_codon:yes stop_codon:yes gene_type:complete